jgi:hypothetical protein
MRAETSDLLAVLDSLDNTLTDIIFGLRDGTLPPDQQVRLARLFEEVGLLLEHHAAVVLLDNAKQREAKRNVRRPTRAGGRTSRKP